MLGIISSNIFWVESQSFWAKKGVHIKKMFPDAPSRSFQDTSEHQRGISILVARIHIGTLPMQWRLRGCSDVFLDLLRWICHILCVWMCSGGCCFVSNCYNSWQLKLYVQWCPTFQHIFHTIQLWVYHGLSKHGVCTPKCLFKWENHDKRSNCGLRYPISRQTIHSLEFHSWRMTPSADPQLGLLQSAI